MENHPGRNRKRNSNFGVVSLTDFELEFKICFLVFMNWNLNLKSLKLVEGNVCREIG